MNPLYKYGALAIISAALFIAAVVWHGKKVDALVLKTQTELAVQYNSRLIALQNSADASSLSLQEQLKKIQDVKQTEIAGINKRHAAIVASLSNRPERPTSSVSTGGSTSVATATERGTGIGLYREDSTFLAGEAARAEIIKAELLQCYNSYDAVRDAIMKFSKENPIESMPQL